MIPSPLSALGIELLPITRTWCSQWFEFNFNIPENKCTSYFDWQNDLGHVLHKTGMFPRDSHFAQCIESSDNGFIALLALLTNTHPVL
jgi:hypothetical protein